MTIHPVLRTKGTAIAAARGLSFSDYLERLIEEDLRNPRPSVFDASTSVPHRAREERAEQAADEASQIRNKAKPRRTNT